MESEFPTALVLIGGLLLLGSIVLGESVRKWAQTTAKYRIPNYLYPKSPEERGKVMIGLLPFDIHMVPTPKGLYIKFPFEGRVSAPQFSPLCIPWYDIVFVPGTTDEGGGQKPDSRLKIESVNASIIFRTASLSRLTSYAERDPGT